MVCGFCAIVEARHCSHARTSFLAARSPRSRPCRRTAGSAVFSAPLTLGAFFVQHRLGFRPADGTGNSGRMYGPFTSTIIVGIEPGSRNQIVRPGFGVSRETVWHLRLNASF